MKKIMFVGLLLFLGIGQSAKAMTQPDDVVGVYLEIGEDPLLAKSKKYTKKWKDIKLASATKSALISRNAKLDAEGYGEKYRLAFLFVLNDDVIRVAWFGDLGSVTMSTWPQGETCTLSFLGNGGFAGIHGKPCRVE